MQPVSRCSALRPRVLCSATVCALLIAAPIECRAAALSFDEAIRIGTRDACVVVSEASWQALQGAKLGAWLVKSAPRGVGRC